MEERICQMCCFWGWDGDKQHIYMNADGKYRAECSAKLVVDLFYDDFPPSPTAEFGCNQWEAIKHG